MAYQHKTVKSTFTVTGVKAIQEAFTKLPKTIALKVVRKGMRQALKPMLAEARVNAPIGKSKGSHKAGELKKAIKIKAGKRKKDRVRLNVSIGARDFVGDTYYGAMVEYGTVKQKAQHFMKRTFDAKSSKVAFDAEKLIGLATLRAVYGLKI